MAIVMPPYSPAGMNVNSGYTPGGAYTNAQATGFDPNAALYALMQREQQPTAVVGEPSFQQRPQNRPAMPSGGGMGSMSSGGKGTGGGPSAAAQGHPIYSKMIQGAGIIPGRIKLNDWEPGADASGWAPGPAPTGPANSHFVDTGEGGGNAPAGAGGLSDPYSPAYRALVDRYGGQQGAQDAIAAQKKAVADAEKGQTRPSMTAPQGISTPGMVATQAQDTRFNPGADKTRKDYNAWPHT